MKRIVKSRVGVVERISGRKTIRVLVETLIKHPKYKKYIKRRKVFLAHDPKEEAKVGDKVLIKEGRPYSKLKSWYLAKILRDVRNNLSRVSDEFIPLQD
ncbi:MAG: 30S ribosomal protein S17 [Deltaproteobacteria bacterium]|nr:30S ribosomal protein S17 [Deltaproteobacteria bacterium]MCX7953402.1 30S ribosomal protein S17 [Deltaproteobacteria bacterium]